MIEQVSPTNFYPLSDNMLDILKRLAKQGLYTTPPISIEDAWSKGVEYGTIGMASVILDEMHINY